MQNLADCITNKKTILFSDHHYKIESFVNYITNKLSVTHPHFFIISSKQYYYHQGQKYYTPYERITNFEFFYNNNDTFTVCCNKIYEFLEQMQIPNNIFIIIDLSQHYFLRKDGKLNLNAIEKFLSMKNITLMVCLNNVAQNVDTALYDNIIMDNCYHPIFYKSQHNYFTQFCNITLKTFQKIMHDDCQSMKLFYLLNRNCAYKFGIRTHPKITCKYKIKNIVSDNFYKSIKKLNGQPNKKLLKKWQKLPKPVFESSEDELMDGFRFS